MEVNLKKTVLFLITKSNWGGAQRYVFDLATNLPREQFIVSVAVGGDGPLKDKLESAGVHTISIPGLQRDVSFKQELLASRSIARLIQAEQPDILHLNSSKAGAIGALIGRWYRVPRLVFTAHGWAFNEDRARLSRWLVGIIHWLTIVLSHVTIAVSHGMKAQMRGPFVQNKLKVVHPGRTIADLKNRPEARRDLAAVVPKLADYQSDNWIGTIAELHPIKHLELAITAIKNLTASHPSLRYVIIGDGELRTKLAQKIANLGLENQVFLSGAIPEAARFLKAFDLFILPSKSESYGYVLVEAGQAGLPVVATSTGGITDLITTEESGLLVPVGDTPALTKAIDRLLNNPDLADKLAQKHHQNMSNVTVAKMVTETIGVYDTSLRH